MKKLVNVNQENLAIIKQSVEALWETPEGSTKKEEGKALRKAVYKEAQKAKEYVEQLDKVLDNLRKTCPHDEGYTVEKYRDDFEQRTTVYHFCKICGKNLLNR